MYMTWAVAALLILIWMTFGFMIDLETKLIGNRYIDDAASVNARGDKAMAETKKTKMYPPLTKTVLKLKRADDWFSTTLLEVRSEDYLVGLNWRGEDMLVLTLDFGCHAEMSKPVASIGAIRISYRFDRSVILPAHGYSSLPREPRKPCS